MLLQNTALFAFAFVATSALGQSSGDKAWDILIELAETAIGEGGVGDADDKLEALIDLHAQFSRDVLGRPIPSSRLMVVKEGVRSFVQGTLARYEGDQRQATLRLLRDLATNRAVFVDLFNSNTPAAVVEQQMLAYLERNQALGYGEPTTIGSQMSVPPSDTDLQIAIDQIRMITDRGTSGHLNRAIDAGESITINIPLTNHSDVQYRSTSAFLETNDQFVRPDISEVIYSDRRVVEGRTVTFSPGSTVVPKGSFTFTISPECPDSHDVDFELLVWDSDHGKFKIPFTITVFHVGPLDFGKIRIDDDVPGLSNGNGDALIDHGETIEYLVALHNKGTVPIRNIEARLFSTERAIQFSPDGDRLQYKSVEPGQDNSIPAAFIFEVDSDNAVELPDQINMRLLTQGSARGHEYSWVRAITHQTGYSGLIAKAELALSAGQYDEVFDLLWHSPAAQKLRDVQAAKRLRLAARDAKWPLVVQARAHLEKGELTEAFRLSRMAKSKYNKGNFDPNDPRKTEWYSPGYGSRLAQSVEYEIIRERFTDNGDGTIADALTGLTWARGGYVGWQDASAFANDLFKGGFGDWRLPTEAEVKTILFLFTYGGIDKAGIDEMFDLGQYAGVWTDRTEGFGDSKLAYRVLPDHRLKKSEIRPYLEGHCFAVRGKRLIQADRHIWRKPS